MRRLTRKALCALGVLVLAGCVCGVPGQTHAETAGVSPGGAGVPDGGHHDSHFASCDARAVQLPNQLEPLIAAAAGPAMGPVVASVEVGRLGPVPAAPAVFRPPLFLLHTSLLI